MFADRIVDSRELVYRFSEDEAVGAFAVVEKIAGVIKAIILVEKRLPFEPSGMARMARG